MQEIVDFANNNLLLVTGLIASGLAAVFYELRLKARNVASLGIPMAVRMINDGSKIVDVRPAEKYAAGHIVDARNIPADELLGSPDKLKAGKKNTLLVCDNGARSGEVTAKLRKDGNESVFSIRGGLAAWQQDNLPVVRDDDGSAT